MSDLMKVALVMSSLDIAGLTGKRHDHVMADIRNMLNDLELDAPDFSGTVNYKVNNGATREREIFNLPKRETLILVSGYNVKMRAAIIDRIDELEQGKGLNIENAIKLVNEHKALAQIKVNDAERVFKEAQKELILLGGGTLPLSEGQAVVIKYFANKGKAVTERQIIMSRRRVKPFVGMDKNSAKIREVIQELVANGSLTQSSDFATNGKCVKSYRVS